MKTEFNKSDYKILITGGSGFIGTNAVSWLLDNGYAFTNFDINPPLNEDHIEYWQKIDIRNFDLLFSAMQKFKPTHIVNLAADLGMDHKNLDNLQANIMGVENLINVTENEPSIKRIVFTSSLLVCKNGYIPKNDTDYCPPNYYGKSKVIGEQLVRKNELNCEWGIVRPTSIWGPWFEYSYKEFFKSIDKNRYFHIGRDEFQKPACFVGNTVHMMMKILLEENPEINGSTFYLADYPWYSTRKWANTIQIILNSKPLKTAPMWFLKLIAFTGDCLKKFFKLDPPLTSFRLNNMLTGGAYPLENTKKIVGELPFNLDESVLKTTQWMYERNLIKHKPIKI